jgi:hypothetical protein
MMLSRYDTRLWLECPMKKIERFLVKSKFRESDLEELEQLIVEMKEREFILRNNRLALQYLLDKQRFLNHTHSL